MSDAPVPFEVFDETIHLHGTKADLAIGLSVQVLYGGILYMTDPGQVDARSISIEAE